MANDVIDVIERAKKALEEMELKKLENTPVQQILPLIYENSRVLPNAFIRSALFGLVKKGKRETVKDYKVFSFSNYEIKFTGELLNQDDLLVYDTIIYMLKNFATGDILITSMYHILQTMGLTQTGNNAKSVWERIKRIKEGNLELISIGKNNRKYISLRSMMDTADYEENSGKIAIKIDKKLLTLFADDITYIKHSLHHGFGENQLAKWLYLFYHSHNNPIPFKVEYIHDLCRSSSNIREFRRTLKNSFIALEKVNISLYINENDEIIRTNYSNLL